MIADHYLQLRTELETALAGLLKLSTEMRRDAANQLGVMRARTAARPLGVEAVSAHGFAADGGEPPTGLREAVGQSKRLVSAIGSSARSRIFYLRVKGETEEAVAALGYPALHIFRPGLLLGLRAESRPREALGMALAPFLNPLMLGPAKAYRGIPADTVAAAIVRKALRPKGA